MPQASTDMIADTTFADAAAQMKGKFWGPVPVADFFDEFFDAKFPCLPSTANYEIQASNVASLKGEPDMYEPLVRFIYFVTKIRPHT